MTEREYGAMGYNALHACHFCGKIDRLSGIEVHSPCLFAVAMTKRDKLPHEKKDVDAYKRLVKLTYRIEGRDRVYYRHDFTIHIFYEFNEF